jgi:hypothetical protein
VRACPCPVTAQINKIMDSLYVYMDEEHRWQEPAVVRSFMAVLRASGGRHHFPMFASLLRHGSHHKLAAADCEAVVRLAAGQVRVVLAAADAACARADRASHTTQHRARARS